MINLKSVVIFANVFNKKLRTLIYIHIRIGNFYEIWLTVSILLNRLFETFDFIPKKNRFWFITFDDIAISIFTS